MELKKCGMEKKVLIQSNTVIIDKNGAKDMPNAKTRLNTK